MSREMETEDEGMLDPLAAALLALGGARGAGGAAAAPVAAQAPPQQRGSKRRSSSSSTGRRGYVWRGPHKQKQQLEPEQLSSSRRSPSDNDVEVAQHAPRRSKEWAALTTWLRMNLSHPRTSKRVVLFVGSQDEATGAWRFSLNPAISWAHDVSAETKARLAHLPQEAEAAYAAKHGRCGPWGSKLQKYKPPGAASAVDVRLWDMVQSLHAIYQQHECQLPQQQQQQQQQQASMQLVPVPWPAPDAAAAAAALAAAAAAGGADSLPDALSTAPQQEQHAKAQHAAAVALGAAGVDRPRPPAPEQRAGCAAAAP